MSRVIVGIDEAGRGPLAGPVSVGVVMVPVHFDWVLLEGVRDSKQMTELGREIWFEKLHILEQHGLRYVVQFSSAQFIDTHGITFAIQNAIVRALHMLDAVPKKSQVLLDGALRAPKKFLDQTTIVKGDETEPLISLASIAAKVKRDRLMRRLALKYPEYGFEVHKGYGTKAHYKALTMHGLCDIHRRSFCHLEEWTK